MSTATLSTVGATARTLSTGARRASLPQRARLRVVAPVASTSGPGFALLLLVGFLVALLTSLVVNTARAEGSYHMTALRHEQTVLSEQRGQLESELTGYRSPDKLAERARDMGMVPAAEAAYITGDGKVLGVAEPAQPEVSPTVGATARD